MINNSVLKNKILDDAMHGLLVKNYDKNSLDELNEIILTNKTMSNKKEMGTFSIDIPYDIPSNWNWIELGKIVEINLGFTHTPKYVSDGVKFLSVKDISSGYIDFNNVKYVSEEEYDNAPYGAKPKKGDILFGRVGTIGVPQIIETDDKFCIFVSLGFLRDFSNKLNKKFICYWMYSNTFKNQVYHVVKGAAQINLNTKWLQSFLIPFPPLEEQKEIVEKIDTLFELIDKKEQNDKEKDKLKKALKDKILDNAFNGLLTSDNMASWKKCIFSDVIDVRDGTHDSPKYIEYSDYPLITSKNLTEHGLDFTNVNYLTEKDYNEINKRSFVDDGDVLFAMIGSIGNPVIVKKERPFAIKNVALFKCGNNILNKFLYYYLLHEKDMSEQTKGGVQKFVSLKILRNYPICLPPLEEQRRIVEKIESLFELIEQL